jgi:diguanylate cyclase (GGDEF)-like protein
MTMAGRAKKTDAGMRDAETTMIEALLHVHSALTLEWLVDGAATAAERGLNAPFSFVYLEDQDGRLDCKAPASDLRRRSQQRLIDALGYDLTRRKLDPQDSPQLAEALDTSAVVVADAGEFLGTLVDVRKAREAMRTLALSTVAIVPLETAGERLGAMLLLFHGAPNDTHVRLLAQHIACAAVNLRNSQAAREAVVIDVARSVFDARKLEHELQRELTRADRYRREVAVAVIEATNLGLLREQFGHFLTDQLLQRLGEALAQHAREIDVIGAYKESGYTMILTEATREGASAAAARLLQTAEQVRFDEAVPGLELHLAAGWAACPADGATSDALFAAAERRMYGAESQVA